MNIINKYIWLIDTVSRAGYSGITFEEINRKYQYADELSDGKEYNVRTFHNHRRDIAEIFGIEILCDTDGYRYYIADDKELKGESRFRRWLLESVSVNNIVAHNKKVCERILLEDIPSAEKSLVVWLTAIQENRMAKFHYTPFGNDAVFTYTHFVPLCLKLFKRRWYVVGHSGNKKNKIYAIDRMSDVELEDRTFVLPQGTAAADYFSGFYGIYLDESVPMELVKLKATPQIADYIRSLPLHRSQKETREKGYSIFTISVRPTCDFVYDLLSYGDSIEVLSPKSLRDTIKNKIRRMSRIYRD